MKSFLGKADLHIHSFYGQDAFSSIEAILKRAKEEKLDVIAITDHHTLEGAKEAKKLAPDFELEVIIGEEVKTKEGDLIALFINDLILPERGVLETIEEIHQQGGLVIVPHPANWFLGGLSFKTLFQIFTKVDGVELLNGSWAGRIKQKESQKLNKLIFNLTPTGGSDAHHFRQVGRAYTLFPGKKVDDLYWAIKKKLTLPGGSSWDWKDKFFWLINSPRLLYLSPKLPFEALFRIVKRLAFKI